MITDKQRQERKNGIFSSDAPRIMMGDGVRVYLEKVGELEEAQVGELEYVQLGNLLESAAITAYEEREGVIVERSPDTLRHSAYPWLGAHVDGLTPGVVVEAKAVGVYNRKLWGAPGTDEVPDRVLWQVQEQMLVTGCKIAHVPVAFATEEALTKFIVSRQVPIELYVVPASQILQDAIFAQCELIWSAVDARVPPAPFKVSDARLLYEHDRGTLVQATPEIIALLGRWVAIHRHIADVERDADKIEADVQMFMKKHSEIRHNGEPLVTWRRAVDSETLDGEALKAQFPGIYRQFLRTKKGSRRFLVKDEAVEAAFSQLQEPSHEIARIGDASAAGAADAGPAGAGD